MVRLPLTPGSAFAAGIVAALLGGAGIAELVPLALSGGGGHYDVTQAVVAPSGARRALLFTEMGGGAAGWCDQRLVIDSAATDKVPTSAQLKAISFDSVLFTSSCGSEIQLAWRGPTELQVGYTLAKAGVTTYQRPVTSDGAIRLHYLIVGQ